VPTTVRVDADLYAVLGVDASAGGDEIARAYRARAKQLHPDTNDDPAASHRFHELVDAYGPGEFDGHVRLRAPEGAGGGRGLIAMNDGYFDELEDVWEMNGEAPEEIEDEEDTTLVVWARTKDADTLNWVVRPGTEPEKWPVMVLNGDANDWETYPVTATAFLAGLLAGEIDSPILSFELVAGDSDA